MIKSIIKFIRNDVYITNETVKTLYLSDGTHWNKSKFHANRNLIVQFLKYEVDTNPDIQSVQLELKDKQDKLAKLTQSVINEIVVSINEMNLIELLANSDSDFILPNGKYEGSSIVTIANEDPDYIDWLLSVRSISIENLLRS